MAFGSTKAATCSLSHHCSSLARWPLLAAADFMSTNGFVLYVHQHFLSPKSTGCCGLQERLSQTMDVALRWRHKPSPSREKAQPCLSHEWHRLVLCVMAFRNTVHIWSSQRPALGRVIYGITTGIENAWEPESKSHYLHNCLRRQIPFFQHYSR